MTASPWLPANENVRGSWRGLLLRGNPRHGDVCPHDDVQAYQRTIANGTIQVVIACTTCFQSYTVKKADHPRHLEYPEYPVLAREAFHQERYERIAEEFREKRAAESAEWWEQYNAYLQTDAWRKRRALVLKRAEYVCEACLEAPATQAHHTTYKHVFNEPLFELRAVCEQCHQAITAMDRGR